MEEKSNIVPIYDIKKSYLENANDGPFIDKNDIPIRKFLSKDKWIDFLGFKLASRIGIPAGPLLNSKWIEIASDLGYDVLTYKTIRSCEFSGHPVPNIIHVDIDEKERIAFATNNIQDIEKIAITNSFGMPSRSREYLKNDIPKAQSLLKEGQLMIISVVGTSLNETSSSKTNIDKSKLSSELLRDFIGTALFAKECGAKAIEVNFSCPNVTSGEGQLYQDPQIILDYGSCIKKAIGDTPLIIKVGTYNDYDKMKKVFKSSQEAGINCICGINSVGMKVIDPKTMEPALGINRITSGICGGPIKDYALDFIKKSRQIIKEESLDGLSLMGCGGITLKKHFDEFLDGGAEIAMTATGMMWNPYLALDYYNNKK